MKKGNQPSVMSHTFSQVPRAEIPRSQFNRSFGLKTTFDAGYLIPILVDEALPGDTFNLSASLFARLATPIVPIMDNMFAETFFFAVPNRLVWDNWQKFNGEQTDPDDSTDFLVPQVNITDDPPGVGSLSDHMGLPVNNTGPWAHSALWHRAYNLIYNEWFRDQNLQDSLVVAKGDGPDLSTAYVLKKRGKRHDYFTSALPWPQKGPAVGIPMGSAPVISNNEIPRMVANAGTFGNDHLWFIDTTNALSVEGPAGGTDGNVHWGTESGLIADLTNVTGATINALRQAFQLQKLYERDARGGTRYTEIIRAHFGVTSPDARLQRPEYLGGGSSSINVNPIAQTSSTDGVTPQGNLAAMGTFSAVGHGFTKSFTEHCLIIGLVCVRADLTYQAGLERQWSRRTRFDFYWPALSHLGEQEILNKEIFLQGDALFDDAVFGYQERYAEYRYKPSQITGLFRSQAAGSLDYWHLAQEFSALPTLNGTFIEENPPIDRVIAVPTQPHFLLDVYYNFKTARPMPTYSVPGLIDHF